MDLCAPPDACEFGEDGELLLLDFFGQRVDKKELGEFNGFGDGGELVKGDDSDVVQ